MGQNINFTFYSYSAAAGSPAVNSYIFFIEVKVLSLHLLTIPPEKDKLKRPYIVWGQNVDTMLKFGLAQ